MKEHRMDNHIIDGALFADNILKYILIPLLFVIGFISYTKGIPYPIIPAALVIIAYYSVSQISIIQMKRSHSPSRVYFLKLIIDVLLITTAIHYTGGIESPIFMLLAVPFIRAAIAFPLRQTVFMVVVGGVAYLGEIWLEYFRVIPHIHIFSIFKANVFQDTSYVVIFTLVIITVLVGTAFLTRYIAQLFNLKLEELGRTKLYADKLVKHLEEAKSTLEAKVEERTRELGESEEKYRNIVEKAFDGIFVFQKNIPLFVNKRFEEITGYSAADLKTVDFRNLIAPESLQLVLEAGSRMLRGEVLPDKHEFIGVQRDGTRIDVETYSTIIQYDGQPAIQAYFRDITDRKRLEAEIRESEEKYRNIVEKSFDGVYILQDHVFKFCNRRFEEITGYSAVELEKLNFRRLIAPEHLEITWERVLKREKGEEVPETYEFTGVRKDGTKREVEVYATAIHYKERPAVQAYIKDVTDRKNLEREILESEGKYRNIVEMAFDGILIVQDEVFQFCNRRFTEIMGYAENELIGEHIAKVVAPKSLDFAIERASKRLNGEDVPETYEFEGVRKDGKNVDVEVCATIISYRGNRAIQAYIKDITSRKKVEMELRETRDFLESIVESSIDSIVATDNKGFISFSSKGAKEMMGYRGFEILKTHVSEYYLEGMNEARQVMRKLETDGRIRNYETSLWSREKGLIYVNVSVSPLKNPKGEIIGTLGVFKDVTEIKKAENELKETKEFLENVIESSIDGITTTDNGGDITFASKGAEEMLDYEKEETIGTHISRYYVNGIEDAKMIMNVLRDKGRLQNYETNLIGKGGRIVPVITSASLLKDEKGRVIGTLGVYKDITEKRRLEDEIMRRNDELENFVYTISHDLKSPLVSLQGFSSILSNDYADKIDEKGRHYLERIKSNTNYMENLIRDLLELSRVGRIVGTFEKIDTSKIIEEVTGRVFNRLEEKKIKLVLGNGFPSILCDKNRLTQVFENLITNAIKFMGDTGDPTIEIGHEMKNELHEFFVKDNGIGIEPEYHKKIFRIFQRLREIENVEGTGVGLAITKKIVENHGGNMWVESAKGKGSTFHFSIPKKGWNRTLLRHNELRQVPGTAEKSVV